MDICKKTGYCKTETIKAYGELPVPDIDVFPFENQILRWMGEYICISKK